MVIECFQCPARFEGTRADARAALWEPWSSATQDALDHGPMVCAECIDRVLADLLAALRSSR